VGRTFLSAIKGSPGPADENVCPTVVKSDGQRRWRCAAISAVLLATLATLAWRQTSFWRNSETLWTHALNCTVNNTRAHNHLGYLLFARGQIDQAIAQYHEALRIKPDFAEAHNNLGAAYVKKGQIDRAIGEFQEALELSPDTAQAHVGLGGIFAGRGQLEQAANHYRKALKFDPDVANTHYNYGVVLNQQGKTANAIFEWREALRLRPDDVDALDQLAWALATSSEPSLRNGPEAVALSQQAVQLGGGNDADLLATLAAAYAEAGRFSEAIETAQRAISLAAARGNTVAVNAFRDQLNHYRAGSPYHEPSNRPQP
jgi:tetratricopeptide (TPR) repeat protein